MIYEYRWMFTDATVSLTDEGEKQIMPAEIERVTPFHNSDLVEGYIADQSKSESLPDERPTSRDIYKAIVTAHRLLFALLYDIDQDLDYDVFQTVHIITEASALADYYLFLPVLAPRITYLLESVPGIWRHIARTPLSFLALASKLQASKIYADALRHIVGRMVQTPSLFKTWGFLRREVTMLGPKTLSLLMSKQFDLKDRVRTLEKELRGLGLSAYQAHAYASKREQGPAVRTTWLNASLGNKMPAESYRWIAASIYREWLDQKIYGDPHWSHVEYVRAVKTRGQSSRSILTSTGEYPRAKNRNGRGRRGVRRSTVLPDRKGLSPIRENQMGIVNAGSLRIVSDAIIEANDIDKGIDVFGQNIAAKFGAILRLPRDSDLNSTAAINAHLRALLKNAAQSITFWFPREPHGTNCVDDRFHAHAEHNTGIGYFTWLGVGDHEIPWAHDQPFELIEVAANMDYASEEWLHVLGMI